MTDKVLLIDDQPLTELLLARMLENEDKLELVSCSNPNSAIDVAKSAQPTVILLDLVMPGLDGLTLLNLFRRHDELKYVPIIMLSAREDPHEKANAFAEGANEYLVKLPDKVEMLARIHYHAQAYRNHKISVQQIKEIREAEHKFRYLFEYSRDAILLVNTENGKIEACNQSSCLLFEQPREKILGADFITIVGGEGNQFLSSLFEEHVRCNKQVNTEIYLGSIPKQRIPVDASATLYDQGKRRFSQWMFRDLSERRMLLNSLEETLAVAEASGRARSEFLTTLGLEIRRPLSELSSLTEYFPDKETPVQQLRKMVTLFQKTSHELCTLVNDLVSLSEIESGQVNIEPTPFNIRDLVQGIILAFRKRADNKNLSLEWTFSDDIPDQLVGDKIRLQQILFNLVSNAIKYTYQGGVKINVKRASRPGEERMVLFAVSDSGIGIPFDKQGIIFSPFEKEDIKEVDSDHGRSKGLGLGLAICKHLTRIMGGNIGVKSKEHQGSTFFVTLDLGLEAPITTLEQMTSPEEDTHAALHSALMRNRRVAMKPCRILLMGDHPDDRTLLDAHIRKLPFELEVEGSYVRAMERHRHRPFALICISSSRHSGGFDGIEEALSGRQPNGDDSLQQQRVPVIGLIPSTLDETEHSRLEALCDHLLMTPVSKVKFLDLLVRIFQS
ncbi:ATP-binding protein [Magnetococcales bacterium HHB-1]